MTEVLVIKPGIATTLQDTGRTGFRAMGVPGSGALDSWSLKLANTIVGNPADAAALEMLYSGVLLEVRGGSMRVAVAGTSAVIESAHASAERQVPAWRSAVVHDGERLRIAPIRDAATAYLAIEGGFDIPRVLGSTSTYVRGALGGFAGRSLGAGDVLPLAQPFAQDRKERALRSPPRLAMPDLLRVITGPDDTRFAADALETFLSTRFVVSPASDRSGLRLQGAALHHAQGFDSTSEGIAPGTVQVPGTGQPVLLLADHPTVGGYPRIATIISADIAAAGRLRIGASVRFAAVDHARADAARSEADAYYKRLIERLVED